jgi:hypothetical protein
MLRKLRAKLAPLMVAFLTCAPPNGAAEDKVLVLRQSGAVIGGRILKVNSAALRVDNIKSGVSIITRAPDWRVIVLNARSKRYWLTTPAQFKGEMTAKLYSEDRERLSKFAWSQPTFVQFLGQKACARSMEMPTKHLAQAKVDGILKARLWSLPTPKLSKEAFEVLSKVYQLPPVAEVPLKLLFDDADDGTVRALETRELTTRAFASSDFACPPDYQQAQSLADAFVDPLSQRAFEGFSHWVEPDLGKKTHAGH